MFIGHSRTIVSSTKWYLKCVLSPLLSLIKYGVNCSLQNKEIKEKSKQTCLKKYGVEHPFQNNEILSK